MGISQQTQNIRKLMVILRIVSPWPVVITKTISKRFMAFISRLLNNRITNLINRFDVPKLPPHMVEKIIIDNIQVEREETTAN
tara:strand:- start:400 stop:648 length:249 start_codon:yes stop_codon:yes gene_type:complete